jgi:hypothetical protein
MAATATIQYHLDTRAGYRALMFDKDPRELEHAWPRGYFFWYLLMQLRSVSQLLYIEYPYVQLAGGRLARLEDLLRQRGIPYEELLPKGIGRLWYRLGLIDHVGIWIGGIPIADDPLLEQALQQRPGHPIWRHMYAVDAPLTPWFRLFEKTRELGSGRGPSGLMDAMLDVGQPSNRYLEFLNECVCAMYILDWPYEYELQTVKLTNDQMLAMFTEAASRCGLSIAEGGTTGPFRDWGEVGNPGVRSRV